MCRSALSRSETHSRRLLLLSSETKSKLPKKKRSGEGWEHVQHVSYTRDLGSDLSHFAASRGPDDVAHVRAMSFSYPQRAVMSDFADGWRARAAEAGGPGGTGGWGAAPRGGEAQAAVEVVGDGYEFDDDLDEDEMDEDDLDDYLQMMAESRAATESQAPLFVDATAADGDDDGVVSPFDAGSAPASVKTLSSEDEVLELTPGNVDLVLDEVRPYLISDGGNVSVRDVDATTGNVYLVLEGACGSCASSTVTMKMGIERVLLEKFGSGLGEVVQVDPEEGEGGGEGGGAATELTVGAIQAEVNRMSNAMVAMGAVVRVVGVDPVGVAEIEFRGPNKVRKGLELALLDVEYCKHVKFVS